MRESTTLTGLLYRTLGLALLLAACSSPPRAIGGDGGGEDAPAPDALPDAAIDALPDALIDAMPDAMADAMIDAPPDAHGPYPDWIAPLAAMPPLCSVDQWCWVAPKPHGITYEHIFRSAPDNIWLVGGKGLVMQWDGVAWHDRTPPLQPGYWRWEIAYSISGTGPNDMWLVIGSTLQHWDGTSWTLREAGNPLQFTYSNVWVAPNGAMWCTMSNGQVAHAEPGGPITHIGIGGYAGNIWGLSSEDFWITSYSAIIHYQAGQFSVSYQGTDIIGMLGGASLDDIWTGGSGVLVHYAGGTWTKVPTGLASNASIYIAEAAAPDDVTFWATNGNNIEQFIMHWDGQTLTKTLVTDELPMVYGASIIDGRWFLVGMDGAVITKDNGHFHSAVDPDGFTLQALWGSSKDDMYWVKADNPGYGLLHHWDGAQWTELPIRAGALDGVVGPGGDEMFAAGVGPDSVDPTMDRIDLWHYDGSWTKTEPLPATPHTQYFTIFRVFALGPGEALAVGSKGTAFHYTAGAWIPIASNETTDLRGVWGPDADHAWITSGSGKMLMWDRAAPGVLTVDPSYTPSSDELWSIHGVDGVVFAGVHNNAAVWRGTLGGPWTRIDANVITEHVFAISPTEVVATTSGQARFGRWDGTAWHLEDSESWAPTGQWMYRPPGGPMYAGGLNLVVTHP